MSRRFRAPTGNGEVLAEPGFDAIPAIIAENQRKLALPDVRIGGLSLPEIRELAQRDVLTAAQEYTESQTGSAPNFPTDAPLLLSGHQPELCHPGVWAKHFALNGLAKQIGGISLNLIVDNDTLKSTVLKFPVCDGRDPTRVRLESVSFDRFDRERPYESREIVDSECFATFAERSATVWKNWGFEPLLNQVWSKVVEHPAKTIGEKFSAIRHQQEREWGCENLELPVSRLTQTRAFAEFIAHISTNAERFRDSYNTAVHAYRREHGIRSRSHPVPDLAADELPFWDQATDGERRSRLMQHPHAIDPCKIRPRALTLTLFLRLCLGDYFIHGIGGGKYDEVTDAIFRDFFDIEPPAYQVLSATLQLPLPGFPTTPADMIALARRERDLYWNPQRHLPEPVASLGETQSWIERRRTLEHQEPADRAARRRRFHELRVIGDRLRTDVEFRIEDAREWRRRAEQELSANAILHRRDFAWVLYPDETLRPFLQQFLEL